MTNKDVQAFLDLLSFLWDAAFHLVRCLRTLSG
jgi:hypothetical protein